MVEIDLIPELNAKLYSKGEGIVQNKTIVYAQGLGILGNNNERIKNLIFNKTSNVNVVNFTYKSHMTNYISGFKNDVEDFQRVVDSVNSLGIPAEEIGGLGVCYGANVIAKYLNKENNLKYAVMIEPYLGPSTLKPFVKAFAKPGLVALKGIRIPFPVGYKKIIHLGSFADAVFEDIEEIKDIPLFVASGGYHSSFSEKYMADWAKRSNGEFRSFNGGNNNELTSIVVGAKEFVKKLG